MAVSGFDIRLTVVVRPPAHGMPSHTLFRCLAVVPGGPARWSSGHMRFTPLIPAFLIVALAGCTDVGAIDSTSEDQQEFALSGRELVIDNDGGDLRLITGEADAVVVQ